MSTHTQNIKFFPVQIAGDFLLCTTPDGSAALWLRASIITSLRIQNGDTIVAHVDEGDKPTAFIAGRFASKTDAERELLELIQALAPAQEGE